MGVKYFRKNNNTHPQTRKMKKVMIKKNDGIKYQTNNKKLLK